MGQIPETSKELIDRLVGKLSARRYMRLVGEVGKAHQFFTPDSTGRSRQVEWEVIWDDREGGDLRLIVAVDRTGHGFWASTAPYAWNELIPKPSHADHSQP